MKQHELEKLEELARTEGPTVMKVGRYFFFGFCAFGASLLPVGLFKHWGFHPDVCRMVGTATMMVCFFVLRDMSKSWDLARRAIYKANRDTTDAGARG